MKRISIIFLLCVITMSLCFNSIVSFASKGTPEIAAPSGLLMDFTTGEILFEKNSNEKRPLASVTKIMTMLLTMEEIANGNLKYDDIVIGSAHAKSYGGSTIFLDEGEKISVNDLLKGIAVASGNDAAVAIAEHISGSEEVFVEKMNSKAKSLGMDNTHFVNSNGLDAEGHYSTAHDIALMSRELMRHNDIFKYTGIWMDSLRNGEFTLTNTNKLIRFYDGATGLKTGSTSKSGFCISATAKRDNLHLIAVIMGADTSKSRNADASTLLDYGFANYSLNRIVSKESVVDSIKIKKSANKFFDIYPEKDFNVLEDKSVKSEYEIKVDISDKIQAPVSKEDILGSIDIISEGKVLKTINLKSNVNIERLGFNDFYKELIGNWFAINL